jgi:anti-sigma factor RsiW
MRHEELRCQEFVELVTDYLDGALSRRERKRVEAHLAGCDGCTAYLQQFRLTIATLGQVAPEEPTDPRTRDALLAIYRDLRG